MVQVHLGPFEVEILRANVANGGLAQMGERLLCTQEVIGSIPLASIEDLRWVFLRVSTLKTEYDLAKNRDNRKKQIVKSDRERENSKKNLNRSSRKGRMVNA